MSRGASAAPPAREEVADGPLPRIAVRLPGASLVAGITARGLNFGRHTDDPAKQVAEAHHALRAWAADGFEGIVGGSQVHGTRLFRADGIAVPEAGSRSAPYALRVADYDGFLTDTPGILLTIGVADCVPALLYAPDPGAVALLHAGWRGVSGAIVPAALAALENAYGLRPADCMAYWGPAIGPCCYPVGEDVVEAIRATAAGARVGAWLRTGDGGQRVDLRAALTVQAEAHGVPEGAITASGYCTSCAPGLFHSYRREQGGGGRMLAFAGFPRPGAPRLR